MELRTLLKSLLGRWKLVLLFVMIGAGAALLVNYRTTPIYQSNASLFVAAADGSTINQLNAGNSFTASRVQSYVSVATSPPVTSHVVDELKLPYSADHLAANITANAPNNKVLINLTVTDTNAARAALVTNAVATAFANEVQTLDTQPQVTPASTAADGTVTPAKTVKVPAVTLTVFETAKPNNTPVSPQRTSNVVIGVAAGLLLGIAIALLRDYLDTRVRDAKDLEELVSAPLMSAVPFDKSAPTDVVAIRSDPHGARAEAFRQLRSNIQFLDVDNTPRIIAVTSSVAGEGKTSTAINLAASLAEAGQRVCLIEADLRRPTIAKVLGLVSDVGLTTVLVGQAEVEDVLQNAGNNFAVMTAGSIPPNPTELLVSQQARSVIDYVATVCDYVILDTAPLLPVADGMEVASMADATLVVARAGTIRREQITRSVEILRRSGVNRIGMVFNALSRNRSGSTDYGYYYYNYAPRDDVKRGRFQRKPAAELASSNGVALEEATGSTAAASSAGTAPAAATTSDTAGTHEATTPSVAASRTSGASD